MDSNVRFRPIADFSEFAHPSLVTDPFQSKLAAMRQPVIGFLLLVGILVFVAWMTVWHTAQPSGTMLEGRVIGIGNRAAGNTGDEPVLTVQLEDGTTHKVLASRGETAVCKLDSPISLIRRGGGLRIGLRGCHLR